LNLRGQLHGRVRGKWMVVEGTRRKNKGRETDAQSRAVLGFSYSRNPALFQKSGRNLALAKIPP